VKGEISPSKSNHLPSAAWMRHFKPLWSLYYRKASAVHFCGSAPNLHWCK